MAKKSKSKTGPKPDRVKIKGNWKDAVAESLKKRPPEGGWPDTDKKKKKD